MLLSFQVCSSDNVLCYLMKLFLYGSCQETSCFNFCKDGQYLALLFYIVPLVFCASSFVYSLIGDDLHIVT